MTWYITKYALTRGILVVTSDASVRDDRYVTLKPRGWNYPVIFYLGSDVFQSLPEAQKAAEEMRRKKIASLKKQVEKFTDFTVRVIEA